ncbi:MAG: GTP-binding protein [Nitrososphaerales archaeon]
MTEKVKLAFIGGFLGAGKTSLMIELGKRLTLSGRRVALITNDQGEVLVDTKTIKDFGFPCAEVLKGCFCCKFPDFIDSLHEILAKIKPNVVLAEPVGSCTDLLATIYAPLRKYYRDEISLSPFLVLVDASTILNYNQKFNLILPRAPLGFLISWQIKEADIIGINKLDLVGDSQLAEVKNLLSDINQEAELFLLSAKTGYNLDELAKILMEREHHTRSSVDVDYDMYGTAEIELGWFNGSWKVTCENNIRPEEFVTEMMTETARRIESKGGQVIHLKLNFSTMEGSAKASLINLEQGVGFTNTLSSPSKAMDIIMNVRAKLDPDGITECVLETLKTVALKHKVEYSDWFAKSFRPPFPKPYYRLYKT